MNNSAKKSKPKGGSQTIREVSPQERMRRVRFSLQFAQTHPGALAEHSKPPGGRGHSSHSRLKDGVKRTLEEMIV